MINELKCLQVVVLSSFHLINSIIFSIKKKRKLLSKLIWGLLVKLQVVKSAGLSETNIQEVPIQHLFVKNNTTKEEDGISFDQIAELFGSL